MKASRFSDAPLNRPGVVDQDNGVFSRSATLVGNVRPHETTYEKTYRSPDHCAED